MLNIKLTHAEYDALTALLRDARKSPALVDSVDIVWGAVHDNLDGTRMCVQSTNIAGMQ